MSGLYCIVFFLKFNYYEGLVVMISGSTGDLTGSVPAVYTEHIRCAAVHSDDMDRGDGRSTRGILHCLHLLLLCKSTKQHSPLVLQ